jgi:hypothetical protein
MIAKINTGSNLYGALAYNQEKVDEGMGKIHVGNNLKEVGIRLNEISAKPVRMVRMNPLVHYTASLFW